MQHYWKMHNSGRRMDNNTADQTFAIKLHAEAIQREYFTPETTDGMITSWGNTYTGNIFSTVITNEAGKEVITVFKI